MRHVQTLNEAQFRKVLHYCRTRRHVNRDTAIFMVSFFAGLRAKEIAALKLGDVFDAEGRVRESAQACLALSQDTLPEGAH